MKHLLLSVILLISFSFVALPAQAARPCKVIVEACLSTGVISKNDSRQVMLDNCVKPIVTGRSIAGVKVDSAVINACKAKIAAQK